MTDPIADFLTRIRNAQMARQSHVKAPYSKTKHDIANVMVKNGFLVSAKKDETEKFPKLIVELPEKKLALKRKSHCGQRLYTGTKNIHKSVDGFGIVIISTSAGVMTGYEARSKNIGGELLCEIS